jgi:hypothetical protein
MLRLRALTLWCVGTLFAIAGCSNDFAPTEMAAGPALGAHQATGGTYQLGDFALFVPDIHGAPRAVLVAMGGPNTKGFVTGEPFGAPVPAVEAALQAFGQSLREFAAAHRIAILGSSRFGRNILEDNAASDQLILDALAEGSAASGAAGLAELPILLYGISGGSPEASGFAARNPEQTVGVFLKVPTALPAMTTETQLQVPVFIAQAELDAFVDNVAITASFAAGRSIGALWARAMEPGVPHHALTPAHQQTTLAWMDAALGKRLAGNSGRIRKGVEQSGWLGDPSTGEVSPWGRYRGDRSMANWLPSRRAAEQWQAFAGF